VGVFARVTLAEWQPWQMTLTLLQTIELSAVKHCRARVTDQNKWLPIG
jgi:hypothetical protein